MDNLGKFKSFIKFLNCRRATETEIELNDDSYLAELEKKIGPRYIDDQPELHGYCDRSFEKHILTLTNGDTGPLSDQIESSSPGNTQVRDEVKEEVDGRLLGKTKTLKSCKKFHHVIYCFKLANKVVG